jgi:hypothetical protein
MKLVCSTPVEQTVAKTAQPQPAGGGREGRVWLIVAEIINLVRLPVQAFSQAS